MLTLKRAQEIKNIFLNEIEITRTIPARLVQPFWEFYNGEFRPGRYSQQPCGCNPKEWIEMVNQVTKEVNQVLASAEQEQSNAVVEEAKEEPVKKKKVTAVVEDKPE